MKIIAHIHTNFPEKFGIPRQSGIVDTPGYIVFEPPYNNPDAVRGLEEFSHIWLIWEFSESKRDQWSPTVRPPRLGGNTRVGVFASRSPFRPNPIGLSCVELEKIEFDSKLGPVLYVRGADILDGTPIFDIKPYLPYSEAKTEARGGFAHKVKDDFMQVIFGAETADSVPPEDLEIIEKLLSQDPRPHYQDDPERVYGMSYKDWEVKFRAVGQMITVVEIFKR
ncbi:MAG: tRNA (N6-threonylcarbamoyladenosine(37)-N6)-methyltransferase TrmO [Firmicutes bacterium]|nr:tRNA (N6-threonylcarbamoyladenosine(37)-N6)-methyltransferase TrmO [Bacillota bacterium]